MPLSCAPSSPISPPRWYRASPPNAPRLVARCDWFEMPKGATYIYIKNITVTFTYVHKHGILKYNMDGYVSMCVYFDRYRYIYIYTVYMCIILRLKNVCTPALSQPRFSSRCWPVLSATSASASITSLTS